MKRIPGIDSHVIVKDNYEGMIELRRLCMVQEGTTIQWGGSPKHSSVYLIVFFFIFLQQKLINYRKIPCKFAPCSIVCGARLVSVAIVP